ncbi:hypothetical protein QNM99_07420 [Pseudomonas sp. PCH446]
MSLAAEHLVAQVLRADPPPFALLYRPESHGPAWWMCCSAKSRCRRH